MQPFDRYFQKKMQNAEFRAFYETECHVCANTVGIFAKAEADGISLTTLAEMVDTTAASLAGLRDADHCDPQLVIRLCRQLGMQEPQVCPRLTRLD